MVSFIDPSEFEHKLSKGNEPKKRGYPNTWDKPHWHGDNMYNPHMRVVMNESDGTRTYYDPVTNTRSHEHTSGYHWAICTDHVQESVPGKKMTFVGGGGHSETVTGQSDIRHGAHSRDNVEGDDYHHVHGSRHEFTGGHSVSHTAGNVTHEHGKDLKFRTMAPSGEGGISFGVGPGTKDAHDNNFSMVHKDGKSRMSLKAPTNGDLWLNTQSNNIVQTAGKDHDTEAADNVNVHAKGGYVLAQGQPIYLTGDVIIQGNLTVSKNVKAAAMFSPDGSVPGPISDSNAAKPQTNNPAPPGVDKGNQVVS